MTARDASGQADGTLTNGPLWAFDKEINTWNIKTDGSNDAVATNRETLFDYPKASTFSGIVLVRSKTGGKRFMSKGLNNGQTGWIFGQGAYYNDAPGFLLRSTAYSNGSTAAIPECTDMKLHTFGFTYHGVPQSSAKYVDIYVDGALRPIAFVDPNLTTFTGEILNNTNLVIANQGAMDTAANDGNVYFAMICPCELTKGDHEYISNYVRGKYAVSQ